MLIVENGDEDDHIHENQRICDDYFWETVSPVLATQMSAVRSFISHFYNHRDSQVDQLFIERFPERLFEEFKRMSESGMKIDRFREKKILFFDVFTFIFRDINFLRDPKLKLFVLIFLEIIKTRESNCLFNPHALILSINICVSHEPYKVLFINENGLYNLYYYFHIRTMNLTQKFLSICESIYEIDLVKKSSLCPLRLGRSVNIILKKTWHPLHEIRGKFCLAVFKMLYRLRLLDEIKFDIDNFFYFTMAFVTCHVYICQDTMFIIYLSKIWTEILNGSRNTFQLTCEEHLIFLSGIFCIDLSRKLMTVYRGSGKLELTKNKKLRMYIIYLSLIGYPVMNHQKKTWLYDVLNQLIFSFRKYLEKYALKDHTIEDQFLIIRHYIKSLVTLDIQISWGENEILTDFVERIVLYPSYKIHSSYLAGLLLFEISDDSIYGESYFTTLLFKIEKFLRGLILTLCDQEYINEMQSHKQLYLSEGKEIDMFSIFDIHFVEIIFFILAERIGTTYKSESTIISESVQYKMFYQLMKMAVLCFDKTKILDEKYLNNYLNFCDGYTCNLSPILFFEDNLDRTSFSALISTLSENENKDVKHTFQTLLSFFILIYEERFISSDNRTFS
ncbi:hypothetical protein RF11_10098 [Thelohanellus kitauei]|uniref:Uncharacterized protein n=1 Tax=Thelohanellus kitauei TaxID=669202 RepID=A0A0C2MBV8_THEKT|nr:hypothetical protein RF11_10098 [Thelohanellus kitauei]